MWFAKKKEKRMAALLEDQHKFIMEQADTLKQAMDLVKRQAPYLDEAAELKGRVDMQERIEECLRLELRLVKANLLMRDLKPDISALERLYLFDDPRS